jgi:predicted permease
VRALPGVGMASGAAMLPLGREPRQAAEYFVQGRPEEEPGQRPVAHFQAITPDFLRTLQIPLRLGRDIKDSDGLNTPPVALINESLAKAAFPNQSPVGGRIRTGSDAPWMEIVGVVADTRWWEASQPPRPEVFTASAQGTGGSLSILVRTSLDKDSIARSLRTLLREIDPTVPMRLETMDELFTDALAHPRFRTQLLSSFAGGALILAALGLYGVLAFTVSQRVREIGIRIALGAQRRDVVGLVIGEGMRPALLGIVLGLVGALACSRLLERLLYEVKPADLLTLTTVGLTLIVVAFLACCLPARRAAKLDPMVALRYE